MRAFAITFSTSDAAWEFVAIAKSHLPIECVRRVISYLPGKYYLEAIVR
jgi:hypothetical protein